MKVDTDTLPIQERYDHLLSVISSERFLKKQGLGNDIPFFICPFPPREAVPMDRMRQQLKNRLQQQGIVILEIKEEIQELLQGVLDPESHLIPEVGAKMSQTSFDVMFISGVGEVFPYIRSHNVLSNLQSTAKKQPSVMFFPGVYTQSLEKGASLDLFGRLHDDKYYRAFNIFHWEA